MEVVVAFVVFALTAAAVYEALFGAVRRSVRSAQEIEAWLIAQSLRDERSSLPAPWPTLSQGEASGGWFWRIAASRRDTDAAFTEASGMQAQDLTIEVWRREGRKPMVVLRSVELTRQ